MAHQINWLVAIIQPLIIVAGAPLFAGIIRWIKCHLQNRTSPSIWQPYQNLNKLFHKESVIADTTSTIFRMAPFLVFGIMAMISITIPLFAVNSAIQSFADVIVIIGLFALARFLLALAGMDSGTSFGGMGSSREMTISSIAEPATAIVFFTVAMAASSTNLPNIVHYLSTHSIYLYPSLILAACGFVLVALAETGRIPIDNPSTHLELTMIHEAMILEYSGKYLALIEWSSQIKLLIYTALLINIFAPWGIANQLSLAAIFWGMISFAYKALVLAIALGTTEVNLAKVRLFRAPYLLSLAFIFGILAILIHIIIEVGK